MRLSVGACSQHPFEPLNSKKKGQPSNYPITNEITADCDELICEPSFFTGKKTPTVFKGKTANHVPCFILGKSKKHPRASPINEWRTHTDA